MPGLALRILGPLLLAVGLFVWGYSTGAADKQRDWDLATAAQVKAQLAASEQARATETAMRTRLKEAEDARQRDKTRNDRIAAGLRADAVRLRSDIAEFARGAPGDTVATCREDASALGDVLESALRAHSVCSGHAEEEAATARSLLRAWPAVSGPER